MWHYRRFTLKAFQKQQEGYGEAESMLRFKHLVFFSPTGAARWRGQIYGPPAFQWWPLKPIVYHGVLGSGLFQSIYPPPRSELAGIMASLEWLVVALLVFLGSLILPWLKVVPYFMIGGTLMVAVTYMMQARIEPRFDGMRARILVMGLALVQPWVRGWARYFTWLKFKRTPSEVISTPEETKPPVIRSPGRMVFWNEEGRGREELLPEVIAQLDEEGWSFSTDTGWQNWDVVVYGNLWWNVTLRSVTEYHGGPKCLTRVHLHARPVITTVMIHIFAFSGLSYCLLHEGGIGLVWPSILYLALLAWSWHRARRLKRRVSQLVAVLARKLGLQAVGNGLRPTDDKKSASE